MLRAIQKQARSVSKKWSNSVVLRVPRACSETIEEPKLCQVEAIAQDLEFYSGGRRAFLYKISNWIICLRERREKKKKKYDHMQKRLLLYRIFKYSVMHKVS